LPTVERKAADYGYELDAVKRKIVELGANGAAAWVQGRALPPRPTARLLIEIAKSVRRSDPRFAINLGLEVIRIDKSEQRVKWLALVLAETGAISDAARLMREIVSTGTRLAGSEQRAADELFLLEEVLKEPLPQRLTQCRIDEHTKISHVLLLSDNSIDHKWSIDAVRLHASALAIRNTGRQVVVAILSSDQRSAEAPDGVPLRIIDDIAYHHLSWREASSEKSPSFVRNAAAVLKGFITRHHIDAVQSELNAAMSSIALAAGRQAGVPVILEYAGDEAFQVPTGIQAARTERAMLSRALQFQLASAADGLVLRMPSARNFRPDGDRRTVEFCDIVIDRPDAATRVAGHDGHGFRDRSPLAGRRVIGFFGESSPYYDLDLFGALPGILAEAYPALPVPGYLAAGIGRPLERLQARASNEGFHDRMRLVRSPRFSMIPSVIAAMDIFVAPLRNDSGILVRTPFEILQALAFGIPVVAPATVEALRWRDAGLPLLIAEGITAASIAEVVASQLTDADSMATARENARIFSARQLAPAIIAQSLDRLYGKRPDHSGRPIENAD